MLQVTLGEVMQALQADAGSKPLERRELESPFPEVSIDSRTLQPGQCYLALRGKSHDGHAFVSEALRKGAAAVITSNRDSTWMVPAGVRLIRVADTLAALHCLAHYLRCKWKGPLLAITGSMGKTTTRQFAASLLAERFQVLQSPGNLNNEFGVPLSLLLLQEKHQFAVLELGMNHPGEIGPLTRICAPDAALVTNVAPVHLEFFSGLDQIAAAKAEVLEGLKGSGTFFFNSDDDRVRKMVQAHPGPKVSFSLESSSDFRAGHYWIESLERMHFQMVTPAGRLAGTTRFAGRHFLYNLVAAVAVAATFGVSPAQIEAGFARLQPPDMRGRLVKLGGATIWDDSYNANPLATNQLLQTVALISGYNRKLLALGEMLELGQSSDAFHRQVGRAAAACDAALLVTVGEQARWIGEGAVAQEFPLDQIRHFANSDEAGEYLAGRLQTGDLLVIKGSRRTRMDRILQILRGVED